MENEQKNEQAGASVEKPAINPGNNAPKPLSSFSDYLKVSWQLYKNHWQGLIGIALLPFLAFIAGGSVVSGLVVAGFLSRGLERSMFFPILIILVLLALAVVVAFFAVAIMSQAGLYIMIKDNAENLSVKDAFLRGKKFALGFLILNFLIGLFIMLWSFLFIIPGIYMAVAYSAALWVYFCEGLKGRAAIKRSKELVKGYWWPVAVRYILVYVLIYALTGTVGWLFSNLDQEIFSIIAVQIISFLFAPFFIIYSYGIYFDLLRVKNN